MKVGFLLFYFLLSFGLPPFLVPQPHPQSSKFIRIVFSFQTFSLVIFHMTSQKLLVNPDFFCYLKEYEKDISFTLSCASRLCLS